MMTEGIVLKNLWFTTKDKISIDVFLLEELCLEHCASALVEVAVDNSSVWRATSSNMREKWPFSVLLFLQEYWQFLVSDLSSCCTPWHLLYHPLHPWPRLSRSLILQRRQFGLLGRWRLVAVDRRRLRISSSIGTILAQAPTPALLHWINWKAKIETCKKHFVNFENNAWWAACSRKKKKKSSFERP